MATNNNLRVGVTQNFSGYFPETKNIALPVLDKNDDPVSLADATSITMKVRSSNPQGTVTLYTMPDAVITGIGGTGNSHIFLTLTSFIRQNKIYELTVVKPAVTFVVDGVIQIDDRIV